MNKKYFKITWIIIFLLVSNNLKAQTNKNPLLNKTSFITITPNPASDYIVINGITNSEIYIIYNLLGKLVMSGNINKTNKIIDISNLINGLYLVKIGNKKTIKIIKR